MRASMAMERLFLLNFGGRTIFRVPNQQSDSLLMPDCTSTVCYDELHRPGVFNVAYTLASTPDEVGCVPG